MRPVERPVQHVARFKVVDLRVFVIPGLVGDFLLGDAADDVFDLARLQEGKGGGIDIDALLAPDLPQGLAGHIGMIEDLRLGRGHEHADRMLEGFEAGHVALELVEHLFEKHGEAAVDGIELRHVDPQPAGLDQIENALSFLSGTVTVTPGFQAMAIRRHGVDGDPFGGKRIDQFRNSLVAEQFMLGQAVAKADRLMTPQVAVTIVKVLDDLAGHAGDPFLVTLADMPD